MDLFRADHQAMRKGRPGVAFRISGNSADRLDKQCARGVIPRVRRKVHRAVKNTLRNEC